MEDHRVRLVGLSSNGSPEHFLKRYIELKSQGHHVVLYPACDHLNQLDPYLKQCRPQTLYFNDDVITYKDVKLTPLSGPATLFFTSGSQGLPKAVVHLDEHLKQSAQESLEELKGTHHRVVITPLPLWHVGGLLNYYRSVYLKAKLCTVKPSQLLTTLEEHEQGLVVLVPTQLQRLLEQTTRYHDNNNFQFYLGGSALTPALISFIEKHKINALASYGMTETAGAVATGLHYLNPFATCKLTLNSESLLTIQTSRLAHFYMIDNELVPLEVHERPNTLTTKDLAQEIDGHIVITGRADEVIISGGENISPRQVYEALKDLPLGQKKLIGMPHPDLGQATYLFIDPYNDQLVEEIQQKLPKIHRPFQVLSWPNFQGIKPSLADFHRKIRES